MSHTIDDYLQTQALKIAPDEVAIAQAATQAVLHNAQAHIDPQLLRHPDLPEFFCEQLHHLKQIFLALDSAHSRDVAQTAVVYASAEASNDLVRVAQIGVPIENRLLVNEDSASQFTAARTAQSGWANIVENVQKWQQIGELHGAHLSRAQAQISLPICGEDGVVYGVLHVEYAQTLPENALAHWVGVALGLLPILRELCPRSPSETQSDINRTFS